MGISLLIFGQGSLPSSNEEVMFIETEEQVSPFEMPNKVNLSTDLQSKYTLTLNRLFDLKASFENSLQTLNNKKSTELEKKADKNINLLNQLSKKINVLESQLKELNSDIKKLKSEYEGNTNNLSMKQKIQVVESNWFTSNNNEEKEIKGWSSEFEYLNLKNQISITKSNHSNCEIAFNGIDPNTLQQKLQIAPENIISYSHPKIEQYYKENSFLTADISVLQMGKNKYALLDIIVRSQDAIKNYGMIKAGSPLKIELINGENVYLFSQANAEGRLIPGTINVKYQVLYSIEKSEYKLLKSSEVDNLGIMWTSGYEKYDIYNIDVLLHQIECLEKF